MKILFTGLGSIGQKHLRLIHSIFPDYELFALRSGNSKNSFPFITDLHSWEEVDFIFPDVAFITSPTYLHLPNAIECAKRGMHLFIEKPISASLDGLDDLQYIVGRKNLTAYVAYPFRFHSGLLSVRKKIKNAVWAGIVCTTDINKWGKASYSFEKEKGGGVLLELSHEIDLAEFLFGPIEQLKGWPRDWKNNIEHGSELTAVFEDDFECDIILDIDSKEEVRFVEWVEPSENKILHYSATEEMYENQLRYFFRNIGNPVLENNLFSASELFRKIMRIRG